MVWACPTKLGRHIVGRPAQQGLAGHPSPSYKEVGRLGLGKNKFSLKFRLYLVACVHVYHPSGGTALPFIYTIIRCEGSCVHQGLSSSWFEAYRSSIRCLLDSFPLLQAAFIALLGGFSTPGSRCERSGIKLGGLAWIHRIRSSFMIKLT